MIQRAAIICTLAIGLLLGGCTPRNVQFFDAPIQASQNATTRLFVDKAGSLYPADPIAPTGPPKKNWDGFLFNEYTRASGYCETSLPGSESASFCQAVEQCRGQAGCDQVEAWHQAQMKVWDARAKIFAAQALARSNDPIVIVMAHGFNNNFSAATTSFDKVREAIDKTLAAQANPIDRARINYLEIYWDGCYNGVGLRCWGRGQSSGPVVGFSLRPFFNAMNQAFAERSISPEMRIIGHSSAAFLYGAILGNPGGVLPNLTNPRDAQYRRFAKFASADEGPYAVPQFDDVRLALFAAATPVQTFTGISDEGGVGLLSRNVAILYAINPDDGTLGKKGAGCSVVGVTCMGKRRSDYCATVVPSINLRNVGAQVIAYNFERRGVFAKQRKAHGFDVYLDQASTPSETSILADWLNPQDIPATGTRRIECGG